MSLHTRVLVAMLLALLLCSVGLLTFFNLDYRRQLNGLAEDRLKKDLPLIRLQLEGIRLRDLRLMALVAEDPDVVSQTNAHQGASLQKVLGPLRGQLSPAATFIAVVDTQGQILAADPFTDLPLGNDAPVKVALQGARDGNLANTRNAQLMVRNAYPPLAIETAWPIRSGTKVVGAAVLVNQVADETLNVFLNGTGLQAAIILPQQRQLLAATPEVRRLSNQGKLPGLFFDPGQNGTIFRETVVGSEPFFFTSQLLPSQPVASHLLLGVSAQVLSDSAAAVARQTALIAVVALLILGVLLLLALRLLLRPLRQLPRAVDVAQSALPIGLLEGPADIAGVAKTVEHLRSQLAEVTQAHHRERDHIGAIIDSMAEGVVVSDVNRRVTLVNPVAKRLLGITGADGATFSAGLIPIHPTGRNPVEITANSRVIKSRSAPIIGEDGQTTGYVTVLRDASQEAELDRLKSEFVGVVSHELRTPLTSIKGSVDLLLDEETGDLTPTQRRFLSTIRRSSDRLINLINDLLDLNRLEAGRVQLDCHPVDVRHLLEDTVSNLLNLFAAKKQTVRTNTEANLPPVLADRQRLEQVLVNLLGNASKYTPEGGDIAIGARVEGTRIVIEVSDSGPGLSPEEAERVFEKFYRAGDGSVQQQTGSGLGLPIARSLVELHGGNVWVNSQPGHGATFAFSLPIYEDEE